MIIRLPSEVEECIKQIGNRTLQKSALEIWAGFYLKSKYKNGDGYFSIPSTYLRSINNRYSNIVKVFIEKGFLEYYERIETGVFEEKRIKYYSTYRNICMKYRFLIEVDEAPKKEIEFNSKVKRRWFEIIKQSLIETGFQPKIKRDGFGLRVWHSAIQTYKKDFANSGYAVIDAKASHPTLLWLLLEREGIRDEKYMEIFEKKKDFYTYVAVELGLKDRQEAKDLFMYWTNGDGYVPNFKIHLLFPKASEFIKRKKSTNYKDMNSFLQQIESKMWIDDIMEKFPVEFGLPIHDSVVVKIKDVEEVYDFIFNKYEKMNFSITYL